MLENEITDLVLAAQTGDRAAYGELVERFQPTVTPWRWLGCAIRRSAGIGAGSLHARHEEAAAAARRSMLRRLVAADHGAYGP